MITSNAVLLSVADSVELLRDRFRAAAHEAIVQHNGRGPFKFKSTEPDTQRFMTSILEEIMDNGVADYARRPGTGPAAQVLVEQGMRREQAEYVAVEVFNALVDEIATNCEGARFGHDTGWYYEMEGDLDLKVLMPTIIPRSTI
ncbi:hypothetical protein D3C71_78880 [compost metagenome]